MTNELVLFGISELAERWEVSRQRATQITALYVDKGLLGEPITLRSGRIWTENQILEFEEKWPRKTGRHWT